MNPLESIRKNKNLLRVAAELGGMRSEGGKNDGIDEIEDVSATNQEPAVTETIELDSSEEEDVNETVNQLSDLVLEQLSTLEDNLEEELTDENLDFAINKIIDNLLSEESKSVKAPAGFHWMKHGDNEYKLMKHKDKFKPHKDGSLEAKFDVQKLHKSQE